MSGITKHFNHRRSFNCFCADNHFAVMKLMKSCLSHDHTLETGSCHDANCYRNVVTGGTAVCHNDDKVGVMSDRAYFFYVSVALGEIYLNPLWNDVYIHVLQCYTSLASRQFKSHDFPLASASAVWSWGYEWIWPVPYYDKTQQSVNRLRYSRDVLYYIPTIWRDCCDYATPDTYYLMLHHSVQDLFHHDDVIKWKHFLRYWPFVWGIHRSPVNSPHKRPVTRSFDVFFDLRLNRRLNKQSGRRWFSRHRAHYDVTIMGVTVVIMQHQTHTTWCYIIPYKIFSIMYEKRMPYL